MCFDWSALSSPPSSGGEVDPIRLFGALPIRDGTINDLWLGQGDALREWHANRQKKDVAIVLNTGAGKTLVGLLAAQSLVNETRGHVLYACASLQLVQQTADKAASYGLRTSTYVGGGQGFNNSCYQEGIGPCVTTYQALFNGLTRKWTDACAVVFDDAHTAAHIIREQFTLKLDRVSYPAVFDAIASGYSQFLRTIGSDLSFRQACETGDPAARWFVPPFVVRRNWGELDNAIRGARIQEDREQKFPWGYLADRLHVCAVFLSPRRVWFTPPVVPVRALPYFRPEVRRLYLSATLAAEDAFLRTFGKVPDVAISPDSPAGNCERMVLFPGAARAVLDEVSAAKAAIARFKSVVIVPSRREGAKWDDIFGTEPLQDAATQVEEFKKAPAPAKLRLVARYDGVDLPGDTCRTMVIDGLPSGLGPLERYMWENLRVFNVLRSTVASRIVQSFGRISRGMADHGVVLVAGPALSDWLLTPANRQALPRFLRRQIEIGLDLSKMIGAEDISRLVEQCLAQDGGWRAHYSAAMVGFDGRGDATSDSALASAAEVEADFGHHLWNCDYVEAAAALRSGRDCLFAVSKGLGAWYLLWLGYTCELLGDQEEARRQYQHARRAERSLPIPPTVVIGETAPPEPDDGQVDEIVRYLQGPGDPLGMLDKETRALDGGSPKQVEEATRCLGMYLGLMSSRPDNDIGTGPDVVWWMPGMTAWSLELKTDKRPGGTYYKDDVKDAKDHIEWVRSHTDASAVRPAIVGEHLPPDARANPGDDLLVMSLPELRGLRDKVRAAVETVKTVALPLTLRSEVRRAFGNAGLLWSDLSRSMPGVPLKAII